MITNCSGERSFSTLKLVKNQHRSIMTQSRLNALSIMNIESDLIEQIDFEEVISDFSAQKSRRKII